MVPRWHIQLFPINEIHYVEGWNKNTNSATKQLQVHEIKFDEYGIMDDGVDETTDVQLARARGEEAVDGAAAAAVDVDEDLFDDEDLDELEGDLDALDI